jgi:hypothetical protein
MSQDATSETAVLLPHDIEERAAILEFCEGLSREQADTQTLAEFGYHSWEDLLVPQG